MVAFNGKLEVAMILRGPSMTVVESQLQVIAASSETKHGNL